MPELPGLSTIKPVPVRINTDPKGELWKVLTASGLGEESRSFGEIYLVTSRDGAMRGNHYHPGITEWFLVLRGRMRCSVAVPDTGEKTSFLLDARNPAVIKVPAGIAHGFSSVGEEPATLLAYADREYDEESPDTFAYECQ